MSTKLDSWSFQSTRSIRLATLTEIETLMDRMRRNEDYLKKLAKESTPASISTFVENENIVDYLLRFGQVSFKIRFDVNAYGFKSAEQVKKNVLALKKAWNDAINVSFSEEEHRVEVSIKIP